MKEETKVFLAVIAGITLWFCCIALGPHAPARIPEQITDYQACLKQKADGQLERQQLLENCLKVKSCDALQ